ncbi:MAG: hypothetical protein O3A10_08300 [Chloroflexi bacterium]|nr:hypothetical protein [Chloroflexota bacterium]MDA1146587.1 hypothetical protein [Chloroflexota bacterium]
MSDWFESTEGDLDPDLTDEAGYGPWEPSKRSWWPVALQVLGWLALISMLGTVALVFIR